MVLHMASYQVPTDHKAFHEQTVESMMFVTYIVYDTYYTSILLTGDYHSAICHTHIFTDIKQTFRSLHRDD